MPRIDLFYYGDHPDEVSYSQLYENIEEQAVLGDQLGYNGLWVTEHHTTYRGDVPDPLVLLARLSGVTSTLRLGTAIVCAPFYHPIRLAETAIMVDLISGGRLDLGVGSGTGSEEFFRIWGVTQSEASAMAMEVFEILRQAIDDGVVDFHGKYYDYANVVVSPRTERSAQDLIWAAAGRNAVPLAREHGYRLMIPRPLPLESRLEFNAAYREAVAPHGRGEVIHLRSGLVAETRERARELSVDFLRAYAAQYLGLKWTGGPDSEQFDEIAERLSFAVGTAGDVAEKIWEWTDQFDGTEQTAIQFYGPSIAQTTALRAIELFAVELENLQSDVRTGAPVSAS